MVKSKLLLPKTEASFHAEIFIYIFYSPSVPWSQLTHDTNTISYCEGLSSSDTGKENINAVYFHTKYNQNNKMASDFQEIQKTDVYRGRVLWQKKHVSAFLARLDQKY